MDFIGETVINRQLAMGLFALYIVVVSLLRIMADTEFFRLTALKKIWGRRRGLTIHFVSNVALPLICGVVFLSQGAANFPGRENPERMAHSLLAHSAFLTSLKAAEQNVAEPAYVILWQSSDPYSVLAP